MKQSEKKYKCAIIDDDLSSIGILSDYIAMVPKLALVKAFLNPLTAVSELARNQDLDFLFLDINMPVSGLDVAIRLRDKVQYIILVTGHSDHALSAFRVQADKFLVKPVSFPKFLSTINQLLCKKIDI